MVHLVECPSSLCFACWLVAILFSPSNQMNGGCVSLLDRPTDLPLGFYLRFHTLTHPYPTASVSLFLLPLISIDQLFVHVCVVHVWTLFELGVHMFSCEHGLMHILPTLFLYVMLRPMKLGWWDNLFISIFFFVLFAPFLPVSFCSGRSLARSTHMSPMDPKRY